MYSKADIYPNLQVASPPQLEAASGGELGVGRGPTISWLGILIIIVAWRILVELAEEA